MTTVFAMLAVFISLFGNKIHELCIHIAVKLYLYFNKS